MVQAIDNMCPPTHGDLAPLQQNGGVLAFCCPTISQMLHMDSKVGRISSLIITPGAEGEKIAEQLVREAEKHLKGNGCGLVEVTTSDERSDAHAFYERLGYRRTSARFVKDFD